MKGVVLAGGTGSRLWPLTRVTNKHLLPVGRMPMVYHPILKLREARIRRILIVTGRDHAGDVIALLGSGAELGLSFSYQVQDEAGGIAQALALAEEFADGEPLAAILGDNVFEDSLAPSVARFAADPRGALVMLKQVDDAARFGVASLDAAGERVVRIVEKPAHPASDLAVTGIYLYDARVFDHIRGLRPSARGELEITDVNNAYLADGELRFGILEGWWSDAGTPSSYARANRLTADLRPPAELRR